MQETKPLQGNAPVGKPAKPNKAGIMPSEKPVLSKKEQERLNGELLRIVDDNFKTDGKKAEEMERLVNAGADITVKFPANWTILQCAAAHGGIETCALVIRKYAESHRSIKNLIGAKADGDTTALHEAADHGHTKTCALLIREYAKAGGNAKELITAKNEYGATPLHKSALTGNTETCILFIREYARAGGDVTNLIYAEDYKGKIPVQSAIEWGKTETKQFLELIEKLGIAMGNETFNSFMKSFSECVGG
jgi:ankyrin repeat protein